MQFRVEVFVSGAETEKIYRNTIAGAERAGIKQLTMYEPGGASLWPKRIEIKENTGPIDGNTSGWKHVKTVQFTDIPEDQHEWKKRRARHATQAQPT